MANKHVNITLSNGVPQADRPSVRVHKEKRDQVVWTNNSDQAVTVAFSHSPFSSNNFYIPAGESQGSGTSSAAKNTYKYSIIASSGKKLDPDVVIDN